MILFNLTPYTYTYLFPILWKLFQPLFQWGFRDYKDMSMKSNFTLENKNTAINHFLFQS